VETNDGVQISEVDLNLRGPGDRMGPRQSGKSTLLQHVLGKEYQYVTFDDPTNVRLFAEDPEGFLDSYPNKVIFDEAQKVPEIFHYLKMAVDKDRQNYGKYLVTGSAQFSLMNQISESLAGRIGLLTLLPFEREELPAIYQTQSIYQGQYPELIEFKYLHTEAWYSSYVSTYIEKDVRSINDIGNLRDFNRLINLLATLTSSSLNMSELAKKIGVSAMTIKRWISVLEASYIIFLLPPFYENYGKRITKAPKIYFYDTGLVSYLTGIETEKQYKQGPMAGAIFENYVIANIYKTIQHRKLNFDLYYFRTNHGVEVDLIIDKKNSKDFIEIKKSATFNTSMTQNLLTISDLNDNSNDAYYVLYNGQERIYKKIKILPFWLWHQA
jgi:predicted AAA+ superfamily ATPase